MRQGRRLAAVILLAVITMLTIYAHSQSVHAQEQSSSVYTLGKQGALSGNDVGYVARVEVADQKLGTIKTVEVSALAVSTQDTTNLYIVGLQAKPGYGAAPPGYITITDTVTATTTLNTTTTITKKTTTTVTKTIQGRTTTTVVTLTETRLLPQEVTVTNYQNEANNGKTQLVLGVAIAAIVVLLGLLARRG